MYESWGDTAIQSIATFLLHLALSLAQRRVRLQLDFWM